MKNFKLTLTGALLLIVLASGCGEDPAGNKDIGEITITHIPADIPVWDPETNANSSQANPAFKIYINASDSMDPTDPPKAKGLAFILDGVQTGNTYTVTIPLQNPNPGFGEDDYDPDPTIGTSPWSGTARYFSIMISPENTVPHGLNAIWAKGVNNLDRGKQTISWNNPTFVNFRGQTAQAMKDREAALFSDIICSDPYITTD